MSVRAEFVRVAEEMEEGAAERLHPRRRLWGWRDAQGALTL
jgi:hypothetical protein